MSFLLSQIPCWLQTEQWWSLWQPASLNSRSFQFQNTRLDNLRWRLWYHRQPKTIINTNKFYMDVEDLVSDSDDDDTNNEELLFEKKQCTCYQPISLLTHQMLQQNKPLKRSQAKQSLDAWFSSLQKNGT